MLGLKYFKNINEWFVPGVCLIPQTFYIFSHFWNAPMHKLSAVYALYELHLVKKCPFVLLFCTFNPLKPLTHITDIWYWMLLLRTLYWIFFFNVDPLCLFPLEVSPFIDRSIRNIFGKNTAPLHASGSYVYHITFVPVLYVLPSPYTSALKCSINTAFDFWRALRTPRRQTYSLQRTVFSVCLYLH